MNSDRRRIAILGGSFNPVHIGHLILADYARVNCNFDEVWLMLSPQNPLKTHNSELLPDNTRLHMLRLALKDSPGLSECDIELTMPRPSYTVDTLRELHRRYPDCDFTILIGADNYARFDHWREPDEILQLADVIVYPRPGYAMPDSSTPGITPLHAPMIEISSTDIRRAAPEGRIVSHMLPPAVYRYILSHNLYR